MESDIEMSRLVNDKKLEMTDSFRNDVFIEGILEKEGFYACTTVGRSMYPLLRNKKDVVVIKPVTGKLKKYDVPVYKVDGQNKSRYIMHRIIKVKPDMYVIRGDNCMIKEYVSGKDIVGVLAEISRRSRDGNLKPVNMQGIGYRFYCSAWNKLFLARLIYRKVKNLFRRVN